MAVHDLKKVARWSRDGHDQVEGGDKSGAYVERRCAYSDKQLQKDRALSVVVFETPTLRMVR